MRQLSRTTQATVDASASTAAVERLDGDTATVLVFLNQSVTSDLQPQPRIDRNRVEVAMQQVDGRWLAAGIKAL